MQMCTYIYIYKDVLSRILSFPMKCLGCVFLLFRGNVLATYLSPPPLCNGERALDWLNKVNVSRRMSRLLIVNAPAVGSLLMESTRLPVDIYCHFILP